MNENKWVNTLRVVAENPESQLSIHDRLVGGDIKLLCNETLTDIDTAFSNFGEDKNFDHFVSVIKDILAEFNDELDSKFDSSDIVAEPEIQTIYAAITEFANTSVAQGRMTTEESDKLRTEMTIFDTPLGRDKPIAKKEKPEGMNRPQIVERAQINSERKYFVSQMVQNTRLLVRAIEDYENGTTEDPSATLVDQFNTVMVNISVQWNRLGTSEVAEESGIQEQIKDVCYSHFTETLIGMTFMIDNLFHKGDITDEVYSTLRSMVDSVYMSPRQIEFHETEKNESSESIMSLKSKSGALKQTIDTYLDEYEISRSQGTDYPILDNIRSATNSIFESWSRLEQDDRLAGIQYVSDSLRQSIVALNSIKDNLDIDQKNFIESVGVIEAIAKAIQKESK